MNISKFLAKIISKIGNLCIETSKKIYQESQKKELFDGLRLKATKLYV